MKPEFFYRKYTFIVWKWLKIFYSKYCPSLAIHFSHLSGNWWMPRQKKLSLFGGKPVIEPFSYIFVRSEVLVRKCVSHRCKLNSNRTEPSLVSKPRAKVFPNWTLRSFTWSVLLYMMVHYHEAKLFCVAFFDILVVFHAKLDSNRSFVIGSAQY